jgi:hypothetical protein
MADRIRSTENLEMSTLSVFEQWKSSLKTLLIGNDLKNVFNMDETGFFFRALPNSTLNHVK